MVVAYLCGAQGTHRGSQRRRIFGQVFRRTAGLVSAAAGASMTTLELRLLGPPEILVEGKRISVSRRQSRAVLYYLAERGQAVSRDRLMLLLWGDEEIPLAKRSSRLRQVLHRLREALPSGILQTDRHGVALHAERVRVDVRAFREASERIQRTLAPLPPGEPLSVGLVAAIQQALDLWHGQEFLEGEALGSPALEDWLSTTRTQLQRARVGLIRRLVTHFENRGLFEDAQFWVEAWLLLESAEPEAHAAWMRICHLMGQPQKALWPLQRLERRAPEDAAFVRSVLRREFPDMFQGVPRLQDRPDVPLLPLIGKEMALAQLYTTVSEGRGAVVLAGRGMGKSLLLDQFQQRLPGDYQVLHYHCRPDETRQPYATLAALLREHVPAEAWDALPTVWRARLSTMLPELAERYPQLKPPLALPLTQQREQIALALTELMARLSRPQPLLLCLDDAHWMDADSLHALGYMLARLRRRAPLVLAVDTAYLSSLEPGFRQVVRPPLWKEISLTPLTPDQTRALMTEILGDVVSDAFAAFFYKKSGGNPELLTALLRSFLEKYPGSNFDIPPEQLDYPAHIHAHYAALLESMSLPARQILEALAVCRFPPTDEILALLLQKDVVALKPLLEELTDANWLHRESTGGWQLAHELLQQVVLNAMPAVRKQTLHWRLAQLLDSRPELAPAPWQIGLHFEQAGEYRLAFDRYLAAARQDVLRGEISLAARTAEHAEELLHRSPEDFTDEQVLQLYELLDHVYMILDRADALMAAFQRLQQEAHRRASPLLNGMACYGLADAALLQGRWAEGEAHIQAAITAFYQAQHPVRGLWGRTLRAVYHYMRGDLGRAQRLLEQVASEVDSMPLTPEVYPLRAHVRYQQGLVAALRGHPQQGKTYSLEVLQYAQTHSDAGGELLALCNLTLCCYLLAEYSEAQRYGQRAAQLAERIRNLRFLGYALLYRALSALAQGEVEAAVDLAYQANSLGEIYQHPEIQGLAYRLVGDTYMALEDPFQALAWYRKASDSGHGTFLEGDLMLRIGMAYLRHKQIAQVSQLVQEALSLARRFDQGYVILNAHLVTAEWQAQSGLQEKALAHVVDVARQARDLGLQAEALQADLLQARLLWGSGQREQAFAVLERVLQEATHIGHFWLGLQAMRIWVRWQTAQGARPHDMERRILTELAHLRRHLASPLERRVVTSALQRAASTFVSRVQDELLSVS